MVNIKRIGSGILGAGAVLFVAAGAEAGLPTFDAANIAGTMSIVKNGSQNLKGIGDITNKVGELNTIVGDAAASVSKFQEQYGDEINKGMEMAQKAMARKAEAEAAKAAHDAEVQAQKDAYQAAMDSVAENQQASQPEEEYYEEVEEEVVNAPEETATVVEGAAEDFYGEDAEEKIVKQYQEVESFLDKLVRHFLNGDKSRIIIVPGNHDLYRGATIRSMEAIPDDIRESAKERYLKGDPQYRWSWKDFCFYLINKEEEYASRFKFFVEFYNREICLLGYTFILYTYPNRLHFLQSRPLC